MSTKRASWLLTTSISQSRVQANASIFHQIHRRCFTIERHPLKGRDGERLLGEVHYAEGIMTHFIESQGRRLSNGFQGQFVGGEIEAAMQRLKGPFAQ